MDLDGFANELITRVKGMEMEDGTFKKGNFDNFVIADSGGEKGKGKSVFSIQLSKVICKKIGIPYHRTATLAKPFTFDYIVFDAKVEILIEWVKTLPDCTPIHIDELTKIGYKRDFQKEHVKKLIKFIKICRKFRKIVIGKDLRNLADYRGICLKRGIVQVKGKSKNPDRVDKWCREETDAKIRELAGENELSINRIMQGIRQSPGYQYDIIIADLEDTEYAAYETLSKEMELKSFEEESQTALEQRITILTLVALKKFEGNSGALALEMNRLYQKSVWFKPGAKALVSDAWPRSIKQNARAYGVVEG